MKYGRYWVLVGLALVALTVLWWGQRKNYEPATVSVRLGWLNQAQFAGFYVARDKGFYEEVGLTVDLHELDQNEDQVEELSSRAIDFSVMEAHQVLEGVGGGEDLKAVMAVYQINPHALAAREDSGINGPEDFAGKVIGLAGGEGEGNSLFPIFIERYGNTDNVSYVNLGFNTVDDFLKKRADVIDVYRIDQPYLAEKEGIPLNVIPLDAYGFSTYGDVIAVNNKFLQKNPELVERFVKATRKGWDYALRNQDEAVEITLNYATGDYKDADYQRHILEESVSLVRGSSRQLGRMELVPWSTLYESMRSVGLFKVEFEVSDVYTNEFID